MPCHETRFANDDIRVTCRGSKLLIPMLLLLGTKGHRVHPLAPFMHLV